MSKDRTHIVRRKQMLQEPNHGSQDAADYLRYRAVIVAGRETTMQVIDALYQIRARQLWMLDPNKTYESLQEWMADHFEMSTRQAQRLRRAARLLVAIKGHVSDDAFSMVQEMPEFSRRELDRSPTSEIRLQIIRRLEELTEPGTVPPYSLVQSTVDDFVLSEDQKKKKLFMEELSTIFDHLKKIERALARAGGDRKVTAAIGNLYRVARQWSTECYTNENAACQEGIRAEDDGQVDLQRAVDHAGVAGR